MTACMEWVGLKDKDGYGRMFDQGRNARAHRVSYEMTKGSIPSGMVVMHTCDNPPCVNPDHLKCGTHAENNADRAAKGRNGDQNGERNNNSKLTEADVLYIRSCNRKNADIAKEFNVARSLITMIINRTIWRHI
jgi:hypothetical protein